MDGVLPSSSSSSPSNVRPYLKMWMRAAWQVTTRRRRAHRAPRRPTKRGAFRGGRIVPRRAGQPRRRAPLPNGRRDLFAFGDLRSGGEERRGRRGWWYGQRSSGAAGATGRDRGHRRETRRGGPQACPMPSPEFWCSAHTHAHTDPFVTPRSSSLVGYWLRRTGRGQEVRLEDDGRGEQTVRAPTM